MYVHMPRPLCTQRALVELFMWIYVYSPECNPGRTSAIQLVVVYLVNSEEQ